MKRSIILIMVCLLFIFPVYAIEDPVDIKLYTVGYPSDAIAGYEYTILNTVSFKDFVSYYPFLYPEMKSKPYSFDVALIDNGVLYELKTVAFYGTTPDNPDSLRRDVDFVWIPSSAGDHNLTIVFDYSNKVHEIREDNNNFIFSIYVFPTRKDRYLKFGKDDILLILLVGLYFVFIIYYLIQKKRTIS